MKDMRRLLVLGLLAAGVVGLLAGAFEAWRVGATRAGAFARVESDVRRRFDAAVSALARAASGLAARDDLQRALAGERDPDRRLPGGGDDTRALFDILDAAADGSTAVTLYDTSGVIRAWRGRAAEIPSERITGPAALFVAPGPIGLRLVQVAPVTSGGHRQGSVAAELVISPASALRSLAAEEYEVQTPVAPASLRARYEGAGEAERPLSFLLRARSGEPVLEASVDPADLDAGLARSRRTIA